MNILNKNKTIFIFNLILSTTICIILFITFCPAKSHAKSKTPKFQNKYGTVYIGKSYKYNIVNLPQKTFIKFTINNKKLAKLNSKTGVLIPKKKGSIILKATLNYNNNQKVTIIKKKIIIKNAPIKNDKNVLLSPATHINSINFTVRIKCTKIMQQTQVEKSIISLSKDIYTAKGNFKSLSDDGRFITYELNSSSIKLLSPGDKSMDGTYNLSCTLSPQKYKIQYNEHMLGQSVTGFIFDKDRNAISGATVTLTNNDITVTSKTDKNGYYIIRFPKADNVNMSISCNNYYTQNFENIYLKIAKSICKNVILHRSDFSDNTTSNLSALFKLNSSDNQPKIIKICPISPNSLNSLNTSEPSTKSFLTDGTGNLLLTNTENNILNPESDIINISSSQNTISHSATIFSSDVNVKKDNFNFSYNQYYYIKIYSIYNKNELLENEFYFSFNDFTSNCIVFNILAKKTEKTYYSEELLPVTPGSNIDFKEIYYYSADLYRIGNNQPLCSFNFYENSPTNFQKQIENMNLYLNDGNFYYAVFKVYGYNHNELTNSILYRFKIEHSKIIFESEQIEFTNNYLTQNKLLTLPHLKDTLTNISCLPQDNSCINTVLCSYNIYGKINKVLLTSLSSQTLQHELSTAGNSYIIYTNNNEFNLMH